MNAHRAPNLGVGTARLEGSVPVRAAGPVSRTEGTELGRASALSLQGLALASHPPPHNASAASGETEDFHTGGCK